MVIGITRRWSVNRRRLFKHPLMGKRLSRSEAAIAFRTQMATVYLSSHHPFVLSELYTLDPAVRLSSLSVLLAAASMLEHPVNPSMHINGTIKSTRRIQLVWIDFRVFIFLNTIKTDPQTKCMLWLLSRRVIVAVISPIVISTWPDCHFPRLFHLFPFSKK